MCDDNVYIEIGKGDHEPSVKRNRFPIVLEFCADSRREECRFYVKIVINNKDMSFNKGFCGFNFRKRAQEERGRGK